MWTLPEMTQWWPREQLLWFGSKRNFHVEHVDRGIGSCDGPWVWSTLERVKAGRGVRWALEDATMEVSWAFFTFLLNLGRRGHQEKAFFFSSFFLSWDYLNFRSTRCGWEWICLVPELISCRNIGKAREPSCGFMIREQSGLCPLPRSECPQYMPQPELTMRVQGRVRKC